MIVIGEKLLYFLSKIKLILTIKNIKLLMNLKKKSFYRGKYDF